MIRAWAWTGSEAEFQQIPDHDLFIDPKYDEPRKDLLMYICSNHLYMEPSKIGIHSVRSAKDPSSGILYARSSKQFIKDCFDDRA